MKFAARIYLTLHILAAMWVLNEALNSYNYTEGFYLINNVFAGFSHIEKGLYSAIAVALLAYFVIAPFFIIPFLKKLWRKNRDKTQVF